MEVEQRVKGGEGWRYAKQDGASRAKPSETGEEGKSKAGKSRQQQQSKIEKLPRRMRAKSAHVTTFVDTEVERARTLPQRKSPKLGRVRLVGEDDTPESERNLAVPRTWVRYAEPVPGTWYIPGKDTHTQRSLNFSLFQHLFRFLCPL